MNQILSNLTLILNIIFIADLVIGLLIGFGRGLFKSAFNAISYVILLVIGFFVSTPIASALMNLNISKLNITIEGVQIVTVAQQTPVIMAKMLNVDPSVFTEGSAMLNLATGIEIMLLKIVVIVIWILLCATIFHWLLGILWHFMKPKSVVDSKTGKKIKPKKTFGNRCLGGLVGFAHACINVFLLIMIISGIVSIGESAMTISETTNAMNSSTNNQVANAEVIMYPLMYNEATDVEASNDEYAEIKGYIAQYKDSYLNFVGEIKINNQSIALSSFDSLFTFTSENQKVAIRQQLQEAAEVCTIVAEDLGSFSLESIGQMDVETFNKIWSYIKNMDIIKVVIPVAIDYIDNSGILKEMFGEDTQIDLVSTMEVLKTIDYSTELDHIGNIIVTLIQAGVIKTIAENDGNIDIAELSLSNASIITILDNLSQMKLTDALGTIGIGAFLSSESFNQFVTEYGIDKAELSANLSQVKFSEEITAIKDIISVVSNMGITLKSVSDFKKIDFTKITDEQLAALSSAIMESHLLSDNTKILTQVAINMIPSDYRSFFTAVKLDSTDLYNFLCLAKILINQGILDNTESLDMMDLVAHLSQDDINALASTIVDLSDLVDINGLINFIAKQNLSTYLPNGFEGLDEIDWSAESGQKELVTLFSIVQNIVSSGAISDNALDFTKIDTDALSTLLAQSVIIKNNISPIVENVLKSNETASSLELTMLSSDEWTKEEFEHLFSVVKVVSDMGILKSDFKINELTLTDQQMVDLATALTESKFISINMATLANYVMTKVNLQIALPTLTNEDFTYDEYMSIFKLVNVAHNVGLFNGNITLETLTLSDSDIESLANALASSNIIKHNLSSVLNSFLEKNNVSITLDIQESYLTANEYKALFKSAMMLKETGILNGSLDLSSMDTDALAAQLAQSQIISHNMNGVLSFALSKIDTLSDVTLTYLDSYSENELKALLKSVKDLLSTNLMNGDLALTDEQIETLSVDFSSSEFIKANLTTLLKKFLANNESVPQSLVDDLPENSSDWTYDNIKGLLTAVKVYASTGSDITSFAQVDDATITVMLKSSVLSQVLKSLLIEETTTGSLKDVLVLSDTALANFNDVYSGDTLTQKGELHILLDTFKVIMNTTTITDFSSLDINAILGVDSATLCQSRIIEDTAIKYIKDMAQDSLKDYLVISIDDNAWYDTYTNNIRQEGELGYLLDGLKALLGDHGDVNNFSSLTISTLLSHIDAINQSAILSDSMINVISTKGGSALVILDSYNSSSTSYDKSLWTTGGELKRLLTAMGVLLGTDKGLDNVNLDNFDINTILKNESTILDSVILEASAIKYVKDALASNSTVIIPTDKNTYYYLSNTTYYPNNQLVWEKTSTNNGELRDLLAALKVILDLDGDGNYSDLNSLSCDMNTFMSLTDSQIKTLCNSRVMEATITSVVSPIVTTGSMSKYITTPTDGFRWYREANEQVPYRTFPYICGLLRAFVALKAAGVDYNNIDFSSIMAADSAAVASALYDYSDVLRASIPQFLNTLVDDQIATLPTAVQSYTKNLLSENSKYVYESSDFTSKDDVKAELDSINTILNS